jgi:cytidyltransferase-like protein
MPQKKDKNGYIDMVGDLFHYGHIRLIKNVYDMGYNVIVGVHSDKTVESYKRTPILNLNERAEIIESCKYVTMVIKDAPLYITEEYLNENNIDMVFHSHKIEENERYKKMYEVPEQLNKFTRTEYTPEISTSDIINRVKNH